MPSTAHRPLPTAHSRPAFTLTEVMIALALVSFLLIGISRIFALTSTTIGTGQAFSAVMRTQRAIGQTMSADFLGVGPSLSNTIAGSGMTPLVNTAEPTSGAPFLAIASFRIPTYLNQAAMSADANAPVDQTSPVSPAQYRSRSLAIRGVDLDNNGTETSSPILSGGEITPLYWYGDRNFRCDTIGFFTHGDFHSQTGSFNRTIDNVSSTDAWTWYGHLRVYNSQPGREMYADGNGSPGELLTTGNYLNRNNRFAEQFQLGRFQMLLVEPTDHDGITPASVTNPAGQLQNYNTVTLDGDPSMPVYFAARKWWDTTYRDTGSSPPRPVMGPIDVNAAIRVFDKTAGDNEVVFVDPKTGNETIGSGPSGSINYALFHCRCDVAGAGLPQMRARASYLQKLDVSDPPASGQQLWWGGLPVSWNNRFWCNPFVADFSSRSMSRRQQILASGATQFIVEFAGDFVTQATNGNVTAAVPDGVTDFTLVNNVRLTRWYGMPRDIDGDGSITTGNGRFQSADVIPLRDFAGALTPSQTEAGFTVKRFPFEKRFPASTTGDYGKEVTEPSTNASTGRAANGSPDDTAYVCVWGPTEEETATPVIVNGQSTNAYAVPQMLRILVELRDLSGKLAEPQVQEFVFPVPARK